MGPAWKAVHPATKGMMKTGRIPICLDQQHRSPNVPHN
eukprot:CAMPEP_0117583622 /NCGR_PEP_ID=MMETSP0784-20121206/67124_1 /TAXON_ID=39447 /ORGANISM="" /LENGTH=37 /DNA_ID= /DNA_START= /DNA_END= /DNA_ORIENTATION=